MKEKSNAFPALISRYKRELSSFCNQGEIQGRDKGRGDLTASITIPLSCLLLDHVALSPSIKELFNSSPRSSFFSSPPPPPPPPPTRLLSVKSSSFIFPFLCGMYVMSAVFFFLYPLSLSLSLSHCRFIT